MNQKVAGEGCSTVAEDSYMVPEPSTRLTNLPTYVFAELDEMKAAARKRGADLIDLGMGNPDLPTPQPIIDAITQGANNPENHRYPAFKGKPEFREAAAKWLRRRYQVDINPDTEVQPLIGSKEGLAHLTFAYVGPGDISLVPEPYYPVHGRAAWLSGGDVHILPLKAENNFLPDLDSIPVDVAQKAKLFLVNYPNNPTAATAPLAFYEKLVDFCKNHQIILVSDVAYSEICYDGYRPESVLTIPGAKSIAVEFHSFSKSFNMAGWRVGFAAGNPQVIHTLHTMKSNLDYGVASAIQDGATHALNHGEAFLPDIIETYRERRDVVVEGFRELGWTIDPPRATLYVWLPIPPSFNNSKDWCRHLIDATDVVVTPGVAFGTSGDKYFRVSLVSPIATLQKALSRLEEAGVSYQT